MTSLIFKLIDCYKAFAVFCDAFKVESSGISSHNNYPIAFFSKKLNETK